MQSGPNSHPLPNGTWPEEQGHHGGGILHGKLVDMDGVSADCSCNGETTNCTLNDKSCYVWKTCS